MQQNWWSTKLKGEEGASNIFDQNGQQYERCMEDPQRWKENMGRWKETMDQWRIQRKVIWGSTNIEGEQGELNAHKGARRIGWIKNLWSKQSTVWKVKWRSAKVEGEYGELKFFKGEKWTGGSTKGELRTHKGDRITQELRVLQRPKGNRRCTNGKGKQGTLKEGPQRWKEKRGTLKKCCSKQSKVWQVNWRSTKAEGKQGGMMVHKCESRMPGEFYMFDQNSQQHERWVEAPSMWREDTKNWTFTVWVEQQTVLWI